MKQLKKNFRNVYRTAQYFSETQRCDYIRMDSNESIDGLPEDFIRKILEEITPNYLATYPNPKKCTEAVAKYIGVERENVLMTNGSDAAIKMLFEVYVDDKDRIIMTDPTFEMYGVYCTMYGAESVKVPYGDEFSFPFEQYAMELEKGAKLAIIVNPNNPTGTILEQGKLLELVQIAEKQDTLVLVDEAYFLFYDKTMINEISKYKNLIVLRTFSKIMGLAGLRIGFMAADEAIIQDVKKVALTAAVNTIALCFAEKLVSNPKIIDKLVNDYKNEKRYMIEKLEENHITYKEGEANFLLIPCERDLQEVYMAFKEEGILIACRFNKYIRINIGNFAVTDKFIDAYKKILG